MNWIEMQASHCSRAVSTMPIPMSKHESFEMAPHSVVTTMKGNLPNFFSQSIRFSSRSICPFLFGLNRFLQDVGGSRGLPGLLLELPSIASTTKPARPLKTTPRTAAPKHLANALRRSPLQRRDRRKGKGVPAGKLPTRPLLLCQRHAPPASKISRTALPLRPLPSIRCIICSPCKRCRRSKAKSS